MPSNLELTTVGLRGKLYGRNLYAPNDEYPLPKDSNIEKTIGVINTIIGGIAPFKSLDLENTIFGRLLTLENQTPLSQIGLTMLGKQMLLNSMSHASQQILPVINLGNVLDGNPNTKLFTLQSDNRITVKDGESTFSKFLDKISYSYAGLENPLDYNGRIPVTNATYLLNTGKGQLDNLYKAFNTNIYKSDEKALIDRGISIDNPIKSRRNLLASNSKRFFNFDSDVWNPYKNIYSSTAQINASNSMVVSYTYQDSTQEYAKNLEFVESLGSDSIDNKLNKYDLSGQNSWLISEFTPTKSIVWGSDGIDSVTNTCLSQLRGDFNNQNTAVDTDKSETDFNTNFNVSGGLLEYTRNLIKATEGEIGDITRKAFVKGSDLKGFNGSGLWKSNLSEYSSKSGTALKTGVRQHTSLDQYDRFAKTIRFNGNIAYGGGNPDSVVYKSVMPRIHPTRDKDKKLDNKNLMFSLENLAYEIFDNGHGTGIVNDDMGTEVPISEKGPFNGRMMWFPPYGIEINETTNSKYESTTMVGRGEPMYNYMNSERTSTLSFMLIIDYPPHVDTYGDRDRHHADVSEFFAFGGNALKKTSVIGNIEADIERLEKQRKEIIEKGSFYTPNTVSPTPIKIYYPNDVPKPAGKGAYSNLNTVIDDMYKAMYEIDTSVVPDLIDGSVGRLNYDIYYIDELKPVVVNGLTKYKYVSTNPNFSQYTSVGLINPYQDSPNRLNSMLHEVFINEDMAKYYDVVITGSASRLFDTDYNKLLSKRRIDAAKHFIEKRVKTMFNNKVKLNFTEEYALGEKNAVAIGVSKENINKKEVKADRYAEISFRRNGTVIEPIFKAANQSDQDTYNKISKEIENLKTSLDLAKTNPVHDEIISGDKIMKERDSNSKAILNGFESIKDNYYYPVFHSQTPEDFHKRLTFLQQCMRQGSATSFMTKDKESEKSKAKNSVFGRQPICILRIADFFYTKVIIESLNIDYNDTTWDMNPEGFGMQPMVAKVTLTMKVIGGQSLKGPIDALQNAVSYNYYANSTFTKNGIYHLPTSEADKQMQYKSGINGKGGMLKESQDKYDTYINEKNKPK